MEKRRVSAEHDSSNKRDEARRKFRKKYASDKEPINIRTYKSFFSKKVSKSHFLAENEAYIFNIQNFTMNETSLKMEGEVSSKCKRLRVYTIVVFSFIRTFAPSF